MVSGPHGPDCLAKRARFLSVRRRPPFGPILALFPISRMAMEGAMVVESAYRGYRIEVVAVRVEGAWDAEVTIHQTLSGETACMGRLSCRKPTAEIAEERGAAC